MEGSLKTSDCVVKSSFGRKLVLQPCTRCSKFPFHISTFTSVEAVHTCGTAQRLQRYQFIVRNTWSLLWRVITRNLSASAYLTRHGETDWGTLPARHSGLTKPDSCPMTTTMHIHTCTTCTTQVLQTPRVPCAIFRGASTLQNGENKEGSRILDIWNSFKADVGILPLRMLNERDATLKKRTTVEQCPVLYPSLAVNLYPSYEKQISTFWAIATFKYGEQSAHLPPILRRQGMNRDKLQLGKSRHHIAGGCTDDSLHGKRLRKNH